MEVLEELEDAWSPPRHRVGAGGRLQVQKPLPQNSSSLHNANGARSYMAGFAGASMATTSGSVAEPGAEPTAPGYRGPVSGPLLTGFAACVTRPLEIVKH